MMKKSFLLLLCLLAFSFRALGAEIRYTGLVTKDMTIRAKQSKSAPKLGSVSAGDTVEIAEFGEEWTLICQGELEGYILSRNVTELAGGQPYHDEADAQYTGVTLRQLTLRREKNRNAAGAQVIPEGETVYVLELGAEWCRISRHGFTGYVMSSGIGEVAALREGLEVPEQFLPQPEFAANYTAEADVHLSMRKEQDRDSRLTGSVNEDDIVEVMEKDGDYALVRKDGQVGWVLAAHLHYYTRTDAYGPLVPGTVCYPYAATVLRDTEIYDAQTGELLRTVPAGTVLAVSALDSDMAVTLPYDRITGRITATGNLQLEPAAAWDAAQPGQLLSVFHTFYDPEQTTQTQKGRLHNIMEGIRRLQGVTLPAGERFSFNQYCAPYTKGNGYEEGPIINYTSSNKLGYGGGICQVSTTLYNAVLQIPIYIAKWQVHSSYGISYAPLEFDAAVGKGNIDLRLDNTLPYDVRLELQAKGGVLTVRIYREQ